jgi:hypothetical protein
MLFTTNNEIQKIVSKLNFHFNNKTVVKIAIAIHDPVNKSLNNGFKLNNGFISSNRSNISYIIYQKMKKSGRGKFKLKAF